MAGPAPNGAGGFQPQQIPSAKDVQRYLGAAAKAAAAARAAARPRRRALFAAAALAAALGLAAALARLAAAGGGGGGRPAALHLAAPPPREPDEPQLVVAAAASSGTPEGGGETPGDAAGPPSAVAVGGVEFLAAGAAARARLLDALAPPPGAPAPPAPPPREAPHRAELPPPEVDARSGDACAEALALPRVALLFLTKGPLHHEAAWRAWFGAAAGRLPAAALAAAACGGAAGAGAARAACGGARGAAAAAADPIAAQSLFSVYVHAPPAFAGYPPGSMWAGRLVPRRVATAWGSATLAEAARHLLWAAFRDPRNAAFVLLSESDVPLYDPVTLHAQLAGEARSRVNACIHGGMDLRRWSFRMRTPRLHAMLWRKSGQFWGLRRRHAAAVLADAEVFRAFEAHCYGGWDADYGRWRDCYPDEHYFATALAVNFSAAGGEGSSPRAAPLAPEAECACESWGVAFTDWSRGGAHPHAFAPSEVTAATLDRARGAGAPGCDARAAVAAAQAAYVRADAALGGGGNGSWAPPPVCAAPAAGYVAPLADECHLTARKFPPETAQAVRTLLGCVLEHAAAVAGAPGAPPRSEAECEAAAAAAAGTLPGAVAAHLQRLWAGGVPGRR